MPVEEPVVGTETLISFSDADKLASDCLNAAEWRAAVEAHAAEVALLGDEEPGVGVPPQCRRALVTSTATLNRLPWSGQPATAAQPLAWPRKGLSLPSTSIPLALSTACAELAFYLLTNEGQLGRKAQMVMIGQAMETYFPEVADELPTHVRRLIEPFLRVRSRHSAELIP